ncbi:MAG TPA: alpha/beta hydrolase [Gemmataceae bacterium]|jgi:acetyl esterase/lipase|nr:alpha/beta hydrolase [Gemmataceae bacterium]
MKCNRLVALFFVLAQAGWVVAQGPPAIQIENSLTYGKGGESDLMLDLALPTQGNGPFPAVICIHGGSWKSGKRQDLSQIVKTLASRGFVAATVSYRFMQDAKFPAQIEDCKAAVRWLRAHAAQYKIDKDHVGVVGFSAGGHLACLLGTTGKEDNLEGAGGSPDQPSGVQAVVDFFGPTDFTTKDWSEDVETKTLTPFLGDTFANRPDLYRRASPILYVKPNSPPFLILHGTEDKTVSIRQSRSFAKKLEEAGVSVKLIEVPDAGHGWRGDQLLKSIEQMVGFFDIQLRPKR